MMIASNKEGETPLDDISGLKVKIPNITREQLDEIEASNIQKAILKYYLKPSRINFDLSFFNKLHREMFGDVWVWAGQYRQHQTNIGSPANRINQDIIVLKEDLELWDYNLESGVRLHHRAVQIHPFSNGNGRWARFLSDLWLKKHTGLVVNWPEGVDQESPIRKDYLFALKEADNLNYQPLNDLYNRMIN